MEREEEGEVSTVGVGEREHCVQVGTQQFPHLLHQVRVVGGEQGEVVPRHVVQPTARDIQFYVHAGAIPSPVELTDDPDRSQEWILGIERPAKEKQYF